MIRTGIVAVCLFVLSVGPATARSSYGWSLSQSGSLGFPLGALGEVLTSGLVCELGVGYRFETLEHIAVGLSVGAFTTSGAPPVSN